MKKILYIMLFFISAFGYAQKGGNPFGQTEYENTAKEGGAKYDATQASSDDNTKDRGTEPSEPTPPNPGDPTPIDDYIPLLIIAAVGLIAYHTYRKRPSL
ncbi:hypothetical protein KSK37_06555 [Kaistella sp. DKR-2]|uniref:hypothetical protein n=1 Tax=Kaistella soli TaxID=2849654 RepID=UPI001C270D86|nr:hypothetical protein [Kaistella soli]MBU8882739.1 hypothetical protein [Kaistella soli]